MMTLATQTAPNLAFYEAAAQIIPVLFLALVVEEKILGKRDEPTPALELVILAGVVVGMVGELVALNALVRGEPASDIERTAVVYAIVLLFLPFLGRAALPRLEALFETYRWTTAIFYLVFFAVSGLIVGSTFFNYDLVPIAAVGAVVFLIIAIGIRNFEADLRHARSRRATREAEAEVDD